MKAAPSSPQIKESRWIDYVLIGVMSELALYTAARGINQATSGWILMGILAFGSLTSYLMARFFRNTQYVVLDGWIYLGAALAAFFFQGALNGLLPEDTFLPEIWTCGFLCWMLTLGSFGTWRDGPLLFQAVPGLALFGLVGVYDTFPETPFFFFGYLLCLAVLFGRAHARAMLVQAYQSGFSRIEEGVSLSEENSGEDAMLNAMRRGPWRWLAGPEWALASALAVILISLVGAPIIKSSVKDFSGMVQVNLPRQMRAAAKQNSDVTSQSLMRVGTGPHNLSTSIVALAEIGNQHYLRSTTYDRFANNTWDFELGNPAENAQGTRASLLQSLIKPVRQPFALYEMAPDIHYLSLPAETVRVNGVDGAITSADGTYVVRKAPLPNEEITGELMKSGITPGDPSYPEALSSNHNEDLNGVTPRILELVNEITAGKSTDWDKANAIMEEIGRRCKYNLKAPEVPQSANAVDSFIFDQREGYCDLFATAMVVMARAAGISARYAVGYLSEGTEPSKEYPGFSVVRGSDAHAWAELYFKGVGWVVFDATSLAQDVTPGGINRTGSFNVLSFLKNAAFGLGLMAAGFGIWYYRKSLTPVPKSVLVRKRLGKAYASFADSLGRYGKQRRMPFHTPDSWLAEVMPNLGSLAEPAIAMNQQFVAALYSPHTLSDAGLDQLERAVKEFLKLKKVAS